MIIGASHKAVNPDRFRVVVEPEGIIRPIFTLDDGSEIGYDYIIDPHKIFPNGYEDLDSLTFGNLIEDEIRNYAKEEFKDYKKLNTENGEDMSYEAFDEMFSTDSTFSDIIVSNVEKHVPDVVNVYEEPSIQMGQGVDNFFITFADGSDTVVSFDWGEIVSDAYEQGIEAAAKHYASLIIDEIKGL